jgi:hypothetical protein
MFRLPKFLTLKTKQQRRVVEGEGHPDILGTADGKINVDGRRDYVYVRPYEGQGEDGLPRYGIPVQVREGIGVAYLKQPGRKVYIGKDASGQPAIIGGDFTDLQAVGITPAITNPLAPEARVVQTADNYVPLRADAVGNGANPSALVKVNQWLYDVGDGTLGYFEGTPLQADKVDLTTYIPAAQEHRYAILWHDAWLQKQGDDPLVVTQSTAISIFTPLTPTDVAECFDERPADGTPIRAFYLANGATTVVQSFRHIDMRQMINTPRLWGFPTTITHHERIWAARQVVAYDNVSITTGTLDVITGGELVVL